MMLLNKRNVLVASLACLSVGALTIAALSVATSFGPPSRTATQASSSQSAQAMQTKLENDTSMPPQVREQMLREILAHQTKPTTTTGTAQ